MPKKVLIVEHDKDISWIKKYLSSKNIECEEISYLEGALKLVLENPENWRTIILDMKFPITPDETSISSGAGRIFLEKLKECEIEISVLINSRQLFSEYQEYPFVKAQMVGHEFFDAGRLRRSAFGNVQEKVEEQSR